MCVGGSGTPKKQQVIQLKLVIGLVAGVETRL